MSIVILQSKLLATNHLTAVPPFEYLAKTLKINLTGMFKIYLVTIVTAPQNQ